eukprot:gene6821-biopygen13860
MTVFRKVNEREIHHVQLHTPDGGGGGLGVSKLLRHPNLLIPSPPQPPSDPSASASNACRNDHIYRN